MPDPWATRPDPLGEALHFLRMSGTFYCRSEFRAPWGLTLPPFAGCLMLHVLTAGRCQLVVPGAEPRGLQPGDLALVPHGEGHVLQSEPGAATAALFDLPREFQADRYEVIRHGGDGAPCSMICAVVKFDHAAATHLLGLLPRVIVVDGWSSPQLDWMQSTLRFITAEARELRPGGETVITRLADVLVVQAIRAWLTSEPAARTGWLGALGDPSIGRAVALLHRHPEQPWTVGTLAVEAGMSRSAFAARFAALVGEPPMQYATRFRMHAASSELRRGAASLAEVAERMGYQSEAAFSRAFKRVMGIAPGAARRRGAVP